MILDTKRVLIELEYRGIIPLKDAGGTRIECLRGRIWITEHRSTDDIVLDAGESYEILRGGVAVVEALREALVVLRAPASSPARAGLAAPVVRLCSRWPAFGLHLEAVVELARRAGLELAEVVGMSANNFSVALRKRSGSRLSIGIALHRSHVS